MKENDWLKSETPQERDLATFQDFQRQWCDNTLSENNPVVVKANRLSKRLASQYGRAELADDLRQEALMRLAKSSYRGDAQLDTYILYVIQSVNIAEWRQGGGKRRAEFPAEMVDEKSQELFESVLRSMAEEEMMANLLATQNEVRSKILSIIVSTEKQVGRRRLAEIASKRLGRKVTRHEVESVLKQLREVMDPPSGYHKATAG